MYNDFENVNSVKEWLDLFYRLVVKVKPDIDFYQHHALLLNQEALEHMVVQPLKHLDDQGIDISLIETPYPGIVQLGRAWTGDDPFWVDILFGGRQEEPCMLLVNTTVALEVDDDSSPFLDVKCTFNTPIFS